MSSQDTKGSEQVSKCLDDATLPEYLHGQSFNYLEGVWFSDDAHPVEHGSTIVFDSCTYLGLLFVPEFGEYSGDGLALGVSHCTQTVPSVRPNHETRNIGDDEP